MEIVIVRHGQTEADLLDVHEGRADFPLTPLGVEQAQRLAGWMQCHYPPDIIWTSPLSRAQQVADRVAQISGAPVHIHDGLMEWNNGVLAGMRRDEAQRRYPEPVGGRKPHEAVPSGESDLEFRARVEIALSDIIHQSSQYQRVAVVSHGGTISKLLSAFLQLPMVHDYRFTTGDTGCHLLVLHGTQRTVRFMNRQDHVRDTDV